MPRSTPVIKIFPSSLGTDYEDFINISSYDFVPYNGLSDAAFQNAFGQAAPNALTGVSQTGFGELSSTFGRGATGNAEDRFITNAVKRNSFYLPMPDKINFIDGQSWETQDVGAFGFYMGELIKNAVDWNASDLSSTIRTLAEGGMAEYAVKTINNLTSGNFVTQQAAGKVLNPYREQVFNGVQMRTFDFNYTFVAHSQQEQKNIMKIIRSMREDSLPTTESTASIFDDLIDDRNDVDPAAAAALGADEVEADENETGTVNLDLTGQTLQDRWFGVPRIFKIDFLRAVSNASSNSGIPGTSVNTAIPKLKPCICTDISVDYTPNNVWATRVDGSPVAIDVMFKFAEIEIVVAQDVQAGY